MRNEARVQTVNKSAVADFELNEVLNLSLTNFILLVCLSLVSLSPPPSRVGPASD